MSKSTVKRIASQINMRLMNRTPSDTKCKDACCCNCANFLEVFKHPWNAGEARGQISEPFGWACTLFMDEKKLIYCNRGHGLCEMHKANKVAED